MENKLISYLYDEDEISGETYLYCVENGIESIEDINIKDIPDNKGSIYKELLALRNSIVENENNLSDNIDDESLTENSEITDITSSDNAYKQVEQNYESVYLKAIREVDTRTKNVLDTVRKRCFTDEEFYSFILEFKDEVSHPNVKNAGRKTILQILTIANKLRNLHESSFDLENSKEDKAQIELTIDLDRLYPIIGVELKKLSVRSQNAFKELLRDCDNSLNKLYIRISEHTFEVSNLKKVGKKSIPELMHIFSYIKEIVSKSNEWTDNFTNELLEKQKLVSDNILSSKNIDNILSEKQRLGHFPIFKVIQIYLDSLSLRDKLIIDGQINIYEGQIFKSREDIITETKLSSERIRQLKNSILDDLETHIRYISNKDYIDLSYYDINTIKLVNSNECTQFKKNFLLWVLSLISNNYCLLGDDRESFLSPDDKGLNLNLVPEGLNRTFDFKLFIKSFNELYNDKHIRDLKLNLNEYIIDYFKGDIQYDNFDSIIQICKQILTNNYDCLYDGNSIIIEANSYRNIPDIVEEIIREHGSAMAKIEIYEEFKRRYPERKVNISTIGASHNINKNLCPIGRTGTYTLKEWDTGKTRGGTIREFALELIMQKATHIATVDEIVEYIKKFRPTTNEKSIVSNLQAESNNLFSIYIRDGVRYIGITKEEYDPSYVRLAEDAERRDFKTSITLLEEFILKNKRFPYNYSSADESEIRLSRFWSVQKKKKEDKKLSETECNLLDSMLAMYGDLDIPYDDYTWKNRYNELSNYITNKGNGYLPENLKRWYYKNSRLFGNKELKEWQEELFVNLISLWKNA